MGQHGNGTECSAWTEMTVGRKVSRSLERSGLRLQTRKQMQTPREGGRSRRRSGRRAQEPAGGVAEGGRAAGAQGVVEAQGSRVSMGRRWPAGQMPQLPTQPAHSLAGSRAPDPARSCPEGQAAASAPGSSGRGRRLPAASAEPPTPTPGRVTALGARKELHAPPAPAARGALTQRDSQGQQ